MSRISIEETPSGQGRGSDLPATITYRGSKQTYYTFRFLVNRGKKEIAYRAYAYFRWLDDQIDSDSGTREEKIEMVRRQQSILEACYLKVPPGDLCSEEQMLAEMIRDDQEKDSGLKLYLRNMMKVIAFDADRRGRIVSHAELTEYTHLLAVAVTEAMFYFISPDMVPPCEETRYHAVCGAHVVHMLRDSIADISAGYFNIPGEFVQENQVSIEEMHSLAFRKWVYARVKLARQYFTLGRQYFSRVKSLRCRLACAAYLARFEWIANRIEQDGYCLREAYPERKRFRAALWMVWRILTSSLNIPWQDKKSGEQQALPEQCEE